MLTRVMAIVALAVPFGAGAAPGDKTGTRRPENRISTWEPLGFSADSRGRSSEAEKGS